MTKRTTPGIDPEIAAISNVYAALKELEPESQARVLAYVAGKLKIASPLEANQEARLDMRDTFNETRRDERQAERKERDDGDLQGISPVAQKWIARNGLLPKQLSLIFSLGVDEIDLIAKTVPGKGKREKMRSVFLLKGIAAYLSTGAARFTHEQMKEACLHYDAYDANHFADNLKTLSSEISGSKDTGYVLTARGLANATEMVKDMTSKES